MEEPLQYNRTRVPAVVLLLALRPQRQRRAGRRLPALAPPLRERRDRAAGGLRRLVVPPPLRLGGGHVILICFERRVSSVQAIGFGGALVW